MCCWEAALEDAGEKYPSRCAAGVSLRGNHEYAAA